MSLGSSGGSYMCEFAATAWQATLAAGQQAARCCSVRVHACACRHVGAGARLQLCLSLCGMCQFLLPDAFRGPCRFRRPNAAAAHHNKCGSVLPSPVLLLSYVYSPANTVKVCHTLLSLPYMTTNLHALTLQSRHTFCTPFMSSCAPQLVHQVQVCQPRSVVALAQANQPQGTARSQGIALPVVRDTHQRRQTAANT